MYKYCITGHTAGIGEGLYQRLSPNAIGFSLSTGYNINKKVDRQRIVQESQDCDVFINNATDGMGQTLLLIDWFNAYKKTDKIIINVGSRIAELTNATPRHELLAYQAEKLILKEMSTRLVGQGNCDVRYRWFAYVGTEKILKKYPHFTASDYISVEEACNIILS